MSSVLAERRKQRGAVTSIGSKVRYVKFTPEEMAIDAADVDASKPASNGKKIELAPDVAKVFKDSAAVNNALRKIIEALPNSARKRKSA